MTRPDEIDDPLDRAGRDTNLGVPVIRSVLFAGLIACAAIGALLYFQSTGSDLEKHPGVGRKLSRLELQPLTGNSQPLTLDDLAGQVVLLNIWGTWCGPCVAELPDIAAIEKEFRGRPGFKLLAVSYGGRVAEDLEELRWNTEGLLDELGLDMPTYADPQQVTLGAVDEAIGFGGYPTTLILDGSGAIRGVRAGPASEAELGRLITRLLEEP